MAKVLVTGGAGFIGSHLVGKLLERGHGVREQEAVDAVEQATEELQSRGLVR